jgi:ketosteroid isomerase-like protein
MIMTRRGTFRIPMMMVMTAALAACTQERGDSHMSNDGTTEARNKALAEAGFKAWHDGTGSPYDLLADDAMWTIVGHSLASRTYLGRKDFIDNVIRPFNARMSQGLRPTIRGLYAEGDTVVIFFDASGMARDGKPYANTYAWLWEMRDGRIVKAHAFFDSIAFNDLWQRVSPA